MTNAQLVQYLKSGSATLAHYRKYVRRVRRRHTAEYCVNAHAQCALVKGGPCAKDAEKAAGAVLVRRRKVAVEPTPPAERAAARRAIDASHTELMDRPRCRYRFCGQPFTQTSPTQNYCNGVCALAERMAREADKRQAAPDVD